METAAIVALALVLASLVGVVIYLVRRGDAFVDQLLATRDSQTKAVLAAERADYDKKQSDVALASEKTRANALEEFISHDAQETDPAATLAPDDVNGRVLRISRAWGAVHSAAGQAGPATTGAVSDHAAPAAPVPHVPGT